MTNAISEVTRRNLFDAIQLRGIAWWGRLEEVEFLSRIWNLEGLPSTDHRTKTMAGDIWMHRSTFSDWDDAWIFSDRRLNLLGCDDETLLRLLSEIVHPLVRSDAHEAAHIVDVFNEILAADGFEIVERTRVSGHIVYGARRRYAVAPLLAKAKKIAEELSSGYVLQMITRMETAIDSDPALAIGTAKEFVESICKGILVERGQIPTGQENLPLLVKMARAELELMQSADASDAERRMLAGLGQITQSVAELRSKWGTGHGHHPATSGPDLPLARLSVNCATALGIYLFEVHSQARQDPT